MNTFIQWQETISDAYLTDTPPYFPFVEFNISLLPQGSLASIPSNDLIILTLSSSRGRQAPSLKVFAHNSKGKKENSTKLGDFP